MSVATRYGVHYARLLPTANAAAYQKAYISAITYTVTSRTGSQVCTCSACLINRYLLRRSLSTSLRRFDDLQQPETKSPQDRYDVAAHARAAASSLPSTLPSTTHSRRWEMSKRMAHMMDKLLARASIYGQHINNYTGTDYSAIETLRKEIDAQEQKVRNTHTDIDAARTRHHEAHAKQAASQKEIVSLLERKSSWTPEDLERYMSLVRSEHTDEQSVQIAKDGLRAAERDLENARAELERLERKQYHEEQIWSDTIRRNSTWVTFGLMGLNIILLLAQITIFEPYRRRKIVSDVNAALEDKALVAAASVEKHIDDVVEPAGVPLEAVESVSMPTQPLDAIAPTELGLEKEPAGGGVLPVAAGVLYDPIGPTPSQPLRPNSWSDRWEHYKDNLQDLFSERIIQVKKVDITTTALQGAATGVAAIGILFVLWRPK